MSLQELVAKNIRALRKQAGLTQETLAARIRTTRNNVVVIESEQGRNLTLSSIEKLAKALNCSPGDLISDPEQQGKLPKKLLAGLDFAIHALQSFRSRVG